MKMKFKIVVAAIFAAILMSGITLFVPAVLAAEDAQPKEKNWEFNLAPFYLWAVNMSGDLTVKGNTVPLELDFDQMGLDTSVDQTELLKLEAVPERSSAQIMQGSIREQVVELVRILKEDEKVL